MLNTIGDNEQGRFTHVGHVLCKQFRNCAGKKSINLSCHLLLCIMSKEEKCGMNVNLYPCTTLPRLKLNGIPSLIGEMPQPMTLAK